MICPSIVFHFIRWFVYFCFDYCRILFFFFSKLCYFDFCFLFFFAILSHSMYRLMYRSAHPTKYTRNEYPNKKKKKSLQRLSSATRTLMRVTDKTRIRYANIKFIITLFCDDIDCWEYDTILKWERHTGNTTNQQQIDTPSK